MSFRHLSGMWYSGFCLSPKVVLVSTNPATSLLAAPTTAGTAPPGAAVDVTVRQQAKKMRRVDRNSLESNSTLCCAMAANFTHVYVGLETPSRIVCREGSDTRAS